MQLLNFDTIQNLVSFDEKSLQICLALALLFLIHSIVKLIALRKLPPGPIGLPIVGYLPFLGNNPQETFYRLSKKYGSIFCVKLGYKYCVILNSYDVMKETLCHPMSLDKDTDIMYFLEHRGFAHLNGAGWMEQRKFSMHLMKKLGAGRGEWEKHIFEAIPIFLKELSSFEGKPVIIDDLLSNTISGNILSLLIGRRLEKGKDDEYIQLSRDFIQVSLQNLQIVNTSEFMPGMRFFLKLLRIGEDRQGLDTIKKFILTTTAEVNRHKTEAELYDVIDFTNYYLEKLKSMTKIGGKHFFSEYNAVGNINVLLIGGTGTVLSSLEWLFRLAATHQDIQRRIQSELDDVIGSDGKISYQDRTKIPYTFAVLLEAQRISTILSLTPARRAIDDFEISGYTIPKGASIITNMETIHHDPNYWSDPEEFKPERFLSEDGKTLVQNRPGFVPFSIGRRNCPGETVAWMEILAFFTAVMQKFSLSFPPGVKPIFQCTAGIVKRLHSQEICFIQRIVQDK